LIDILKKELTKEFDVAVEHITKICEQEGFTVMLTKSIDGILKKKLQIIQDIQPFLHVTQY